MFTREIMSWLIRNPNHVLTVKDPVVIMKDIMSYLRIQLTVAWLNFDHALSNSKKWPKGKKGQIAPIFPQKNN